jgi:hypothetical protein
LDLTGARELQSLLAQPEWSYTAEEFLEQTSQPTLAIFGKRDAIVDGSESVDVYRRAFAKSGNRNLTIKLFEDADHFMFQPEQQGQTRFVSGYIDAMVQWLEQRKFTADSAAGEARSDTMPQAKAAALPASIDSSISGALLLLDVRSQSEQVGADLQTGATGVADVDVETQAIVFFE